MKAFSVASLFIVLLISRPSHSSSPEQQHVERNLGYFTLPSDELEQFNFARNDPIIDLGGAGLFSRQSEQ
jgi:hypothetical protein